MTAISGGIGCGKTVVSRIVRAMGYRVYDCDSRASRIMDSDSEIKRMIGLRVHPECLNSEGDIDRRRLSEIVFADYEALQMLNSIVHGAVRDDLQRWAARHEGEHLFVETAILYQSGIDRMVDDVWEVEAPLDLRIERVMSRNGVTREDVLARISSQDSFTPEKLHENTLVIVNDGVEPLLPQVEKALG